MELPGWEFRDSVSEYIFKSRIHVLCSDSAEVRNREPNISHKHGGVMNCEKYLLNWMSSEISMQPENKREGVIKAKAEREIQGHLENISQEYP